MNSRLDEENLKLKRAVKELSILNEIGAAISSTIGVDKVTELIMKKCIMHIGTEQGTIWLMSKEQEVNPLKTFVRVTDATIAGLPYRLGVNLVGWMLKNQKPLLSNNLGQDERFKGIDKESAQIRSLLAVPLTLKNKIIGIICLFNKKDNLEFTSDDQRLLSIIAIQSAQTIENARLYEEERKLMVLEEDLRTARSIQQSLLPKGNPKIPGFELVGLSMPAKEVGGDYYDFIPIDDSHWGVAIADVSGKGTPAALLMSNLQACLRGQAVINQSVRDTVIKANLMLSRFMDPGKFITLFYGILNLEDKTFTYTNAGHNFPFLLNKDGNVKTLEKGGTVLGILKDAPYEEETIQLEPASLLLMFTDGITEAVNDQEEMFEEERLLALLQNNSSLPTQQLSDKIVGDVLQFCGNAPQADDITLVLMKTQP
jgi:sigma-B regulation protein RsbU (phosphoserine phosphatase)